jgi:hypothetical protein
MERGGIDGERLGDEEVGGSGSGGEARGVRQGR